MECFSTAYLFYMGLQILVDSWTCLFYSKGVFGGIYLNQNNQAVKKSVAPKKARMKKDVKSKMAAKKWL